MIETRTGKITDIIYNNQGNGYTVAIFETDEDQFTITGNFHVVKANTSYKITGEFKKHKRYGEQFSVQSYEEILPESKDEIELFLASGTIKGIGAKTASAIVDEFGDKSLEILEKEPDKLLVIRGIGKKTLEGIKASYIDSQQFTKIAFKLGEMGVELPKAVKIYKMYGENSINIIKENPYSLVEDVYGIGFRKADEIAEKVGIERDSEFRIRSGILYALEIYISKGSTYVPKDILVDKVIELLDISGDLIENNIVRMSFEGLIQPDNFEGENVVYLYGYYYSEQKVCTNLIGLKKGEIEPLNADIDNLIDDVESKTSISLSNEQRFAVKEALTNNVTVITGGPGTGKTTIINIIIKILKKCNINPAIAAPTGRAAKRITETSGVYAMTIHRLLEYYYSEKNDNMMFGRNSENQLEQNAFIIDEASMVDLKLMEALLDAIKAGSRLIIVGDADQLPSVGAGNVLRDIIKSEYVKTVKLNEIFRQASESLIVVNAHMINNGEYPFTNEKDKDFFMMRRNREPEIIETIKGLFTGRLELYYDFIESSRDIQVLTPTKKGALGTVNLNLVLQQVLNPAAPDINEKTFGNKIFREGDKVMQIRNNYQLEWKRAAESSTGMGVFNGDMGIVDSVDTEYGKITVKYEDKYVQYDTGNLDELELAYAITIHKSQGSEFPAVVMPMTWFPPMLMTRNLLYTGVTRGKKLVVVVGDEGRMHSMVDSNRMDDRYTGLEYRLRKIDIENEKRKNYVEE